VEYLGTNDVEMHPGLAREPGDSMPLLVGLVDQATVRRDADGAISLVQHHGSTSEEARGPDLEELAAKRTAGGGMLDSIANMANSILGAGEYFYSLRFQPEI
jgi:solute carrier family 38 (sodium-coupled neutral amino acid transporter), member 11